jgi:hypothetical protein
VANEAVRSDAFVSSALREATALVVLDALEPKTVTLVQCTVFSVTLLQHGIAKLYYIG